MIETVRAPNPGPFTLDGTNSYVIDGSVIIDPGPAIESHVQRLMEKVRSLSLILVTHRHGDHAPAAALLSARTNVPVTAPEGVLGDEIVTRRLRDGDRIDAGSLVLEAIATPGHTEEHFCFLSDDGDLFTGDMILGEGTTAVFPPDGHMGAYLASLRRLRDRQPARIYPGHGPVRDDAVALIDEYIEHRTMREQQILASLQQEGDATIPELRARIYPELAPGLHRAADAQLLAHLIWLEQKETVRRSGDRYGSAVLSGHRHRE